MGNTHPTILIVDDIPVNVHILEAMLELEYEVHTALNGHDALELAQKCSPDLIILDVMMPAMDGFPSSAARSGTQPNHHPTL